MLASFYRTASRTKSDLVECVSSSIALSTTSSRTFGTGIFHLVVCPFLLILYTKITQTYNTGFTLIWKFVNPTMRQPDRLQKELWNKNRDKVLKAIKKLETQEPYSTVRPRQIEKIVNLHTVEKKDSLRRETIMKHLKKLVKERIIERVARGEYSSKRALIAKKLAQSFLISDVYDVAPRLEGQSFNNFVSNLFPNFDKLEKEYRKKKGNPLQRLQYSRKLKKLLQQKNLAAPYILKGPRESSSS